MRVGLAPIGLEAVVALISSTKEILVFYQIWRAVCVGGGGGGGWCMSTSRLHVWACTGTESGEYAS